MAITNENFQEMINALETSNSIVSNLQVQVVTLQTEAVHKNNLIMNLRKHNSILERELKRTEFGCVVSKRCTKKCKDTLEDLGYVRQICNITSSIWAGNIAWMTKITAAQTVWTRFKTRTMFPEDTIGRIHDKFIVDLGVMLGGEMNVDEAFSINNPHNQIE